jgi:serine/threonine protein kinase
MNDLTNTTSNESVDPDDTPEENTTFGPNFAMPEAGQRIGPNRILEPIAEGGMANIYKVWHEGLEIIRALKILKPGFNEESKQRLQTEAKISAHLHHPNIVEIYGVNFWREMVPYLEMEFIDGFSLKDLMKYQKRVHFTFALSLGYFICNALHYAHSQVYTLYGKPYQGVIHRDIKPANILLSRSGIVKLADFGIAKPSEISLHTVGHKVMGTFSYLSPEQLKGEGLDRRCDIYSLGIVLYELITGVKAFPQKMLAELIQKKMANDFTPLSDFDIDIPKQLCGIIEKSTELKKEKRYATAPEFADDLIGVLKKITNKTPENIVSSYLKNPQGAPRIDRKKKSSMPLALFITAIALIAAAAAIMLFFFNQSGKPEQTKPKGENPKPTIAIGEEVKPGGPVVIGPKKEVPGSTAAFPQDTQKQIAKEEKPTRLPAPSPGDLAKAGLSAVHLKNFKEATARLETAMKMQLPDTVRGAVVIGLLESYLAVKNTPAALRLASGEFINDGYFHLLCGKTFMAAGKFERASESFGNAQTTPSRLYENILQESTYWWAKAQEGIFSMKPNAENRHNCTHAWQQYSRAFCGEKQNTAHCEEALRHILQPEK